MLSTLLLTWLMILVANIFTEKRNMRFMGEKSNSKVGRQSENTHSSMEFMPINTIDCEANAQ